MLIIITGILHFNMINRSSIPHPDTQPSIYITVDWLYWETQD